jgi:hypothetical protein
MPTHPALCRALSPTTLRGIPCRTLLYLARRGHNIHRTTTTPPTQGGGCLVIRPDIVSHGQPKTLWQEGEA